MEDPGYAYEELLDRIYDNGGGENTPTKITLKPPQVLREGTKKTVLADFMDFCTRVHREPEHVMAFILSELQTTGSIDGRKRLVVRGRYTPAGFQIIERRYVNEYVRCEGCKSCDTVVLKENRLVFVRCERCGSTRSVAPVKAFVRKNDN